MSKKSKKNDKSNKSGQGNPEDGRLNEERYPAEELAAEKTWEILDEADECDAALAGEAFGFAFEVAAFPGEVVWFDARVGSKTEAQFGHFTFLGRGPSACFKTTPHCGHENLIGAIGDFLRG